MIAQRNMLIEFSSINIGCVSLTRQAFCNDPLNQQSFDHAAAIAEEIITPVAEKFSSRGWEEVMGCGGTVTSLFTVLRVNRMGGRFITAAGLERFRNAVNDTGSSLALCDGVAPEDRSKLLPAGAAILDAIFRSLKVEKLLPVFSSVGQGLLVELIKRQSRQR
jgi:exopolyphosphatase/guanosine-5'-triphosphate,3'-diphosphate pyrophosphatase